jgi:hypothetical protein
MTTTADTSGTHRRTRRPALVGMAMATTMLLVAAGCGGDDDTTAAGSAGGTGGDLTISVAEPTDGAEVGTPFDLTVETSVPIGEPDTGRHHVHLYYDGNTQDGEYDLVYDPTFTVDRALDPGEHTIEAVIANADHSLTDARQEIAVTVGDGATGAGDADDDTDSDPDDDTDSDATDSGDDIDYGY